MKKKSEIEEEDDGENLCIINADVQRERLRRIIQKQRSLYSLIPSEIQEEDDGENLCIINADVQRERIRQIIQKQRSVYSSIPSSSSSYPVASYSSPFGPRKNSSLIELMKGEKKSLQELLKMQRPSSDAYFKSYFKGSGSGFDRLSRSTGGSSFMERGSVSPNRSTGRRLRRTKSYKSLPEHGTPRRKGFKFRFRLRRRLRIMICGTKF
ncbi:hypothetical protein NE237_004117 [Protea cynaroides]|uniref:Uncharacterized protein n=1 Tax=Protea cynaroides TaxID=273540 RepID=A0A9Q0KI27_9MAGN|nr:hypothetical protein NE237_004117 [Protea cynaroides]